MGKVSLVKRRRTTAICGAGSGSSYVWRGQSVNRHGCGDNVRRIRTWIRRSRKPSDGPDELDDEQDERVWAIRSGPSLAFIMNQSKQTSDDSDALDVQLI